MEEASNKRNILKSLNDVLTVALGTLIEPSDIKLLINYREKRDLNENDPEIIERRNSIMKDVMKVVRPIIEENYNTIPNDKLAQKIADKLLPASGKNSRDNEDLNTPTGRVAKDIRDIANAMRDKEAGLFSAFFSITDDDIKNGIKEKDGLVKKIQKILDANDKQIKAALGVSGVIGAISKQGITEYPETARNNIIAITENTPQFFIPKPQNSNSGKSSLV